MRHDPAGSGVKFLTSTKVRLFLAAWVFFTAHFATNVVREHFPAFSLIGEGTLKVDTYHEFHPDIFQHPDGHWVVGNNVAASYVAAIPLLIFDPILDLLEEHEKEKLQQQGPPEKVEYRTSRHPNSAIFMRLVKQAGLSLRFGGSTVVTSVFLMAPLSALMILLMFRMLCERGLQQKKAFWLSLLFGFGTPVFFRTGVLNHNMMLMYVTFVAFHLLWIRPGQQVPPTLHRRFIAGALCGFGLALDYSGVIPLLSVFGYLIGVRVLTAGWKTGIKESIPFVLGSVPPVLFLLYTQWAMYGNPFFPGQYWMPDVSVTAFSHFENPYSKDGFRGFTLPAPDLFFLNLFDLKYGLYTYGPLLMLGLVPSRWYRSRELLFPRPERAFTAAFFFAFLMFCSANQYSRIQENSGFRYMIPVVPFIFLAASDHLARIPKRWLPVLLVPVLANSWVISMVREPVDESWQDVLSQGPQLPWLNVLKATSPADHFILSHPLLPTALIGMTLLVIFGILRLGSKAPLTEGGFPPDGSEGA